MQGGIYNLQGIRFIFQLFEILVEYNQALLNNKGHAFKIYVYNASCVGGQKSGIKPFR